MSAHVAHRPPLHLPPGGRRLFRVEIALAIVMFGLDRLVVPIPDFVLVPAVACATAVVLLEVGGWVWSYASRLRAMRTRSVSVDPLATRELARRLRVHAREIFKFTEDRSAALGEIRPGGVERLIAFLRGDAQAHVEHRRERHRDETMRLFSARFEWPLQGDLTTAARLGIAPELLIDVSEVDEVDLSSLPRQLLRIAAELEGLSSRGG